MLDAIDGPLARALRGTSNFGRELDSFADLISFGVAPSIALNAFMLSCAAADAVDDYVAGESYDFSPATVLPGMGALTGAAPAKYGFDTKPLMIAALPLRRR